MNRNMRMLDRIARILGGILLIVISPVGFDLPQSAFVSWFAFGFGVINIFSAMVGWCFMYALLGITSGSKE